MFCSIKAKMLLLVISTLTVTAFILMFFTKKGIEKEMLEMEEKSVRNAIYLVKLNVENQYKSFLSHKVLILRKRRVNMRDLTSIVISGIDRLHKMYQEGLITEEKAKEEGIDWIRMLRYGNDTHFLVFDEKDTLLFHENEKISGKNMSHLRDIKGLSLLHPLRQIPEVTGGWYAVFSWGSSDGKAVSKNIGYFDQYPQWNWVVGTAVTIDDLEPEVVRKLDLTVKQLRETFRKIKIARTGFLSLFNGKKELLIHPNLTKEALKDINNPLTGNLMVDDLMAASQNSEKPMQYLWKASSDEEKSKVYESYVTYFKSLDWYIASNAREDEIRMPAKAMVLRQMLFISLIFLFSILITYVVVRRISQPLKELTEYARKLPSYDFSAPESAFHGIERFSSKYKDEVGELAEAFLFMENALKHYIEDLKTTTAAKEKIESELKIAHDIQMGILPKMFPAFPDSPEFDLYAVLKPAREVGGDFYDFFFVDENHLFFVIGDVSGKGVPASLFMAITKTLFKASAVGNTPPSEILSQVNRKLSEDNEAAIFVTVFCGILNIKSGEVLYANGGHNPPLIIRSEQRADSVKVSRNLALGVIESVEYKLEHTVLKPGEVLFMYTDGVTEAMNTEDEIFSERRLKEELSLFREHSTQQISEVLMEKVTAFSQGTPQNDDITLMTLKFIGEKGAP
jgi:sigma-B regulation protein RsbU (phosphoserine phosphatase)